MQDFISIQNLTFKRGARAIVDEMDLDIAQGKIVGIMGPSGCGKTTLLHLIAGQLKPDGGSITVNGVDMSTLNRRQLLQFRRNMGFLFQSGALFTDMDVFHNVAFPLKVHGSKTKQEIEKTVMAKLECVGLREAASLMPRELSGGMNRRVALARAIALDPALMMYDEPFTGQDPISKGVILELIKLVNDEFRMTSLLVSHDIPETLKLADYVYILAGGKIIGRGNPKDLLTDGSPFVKQFLKGEKEGPVPFHYKAAPSQTSLEAGKT